MRKLFELWTKTLVGSIDAVVQYSSRCYAFMEVDYRDLLHMSTPKNGE